MINKILKSILILSCINLNSSPLLRSLLTQNRNITLRNIRTVAQSSKQDTKWNYIDVWGLCVLAGTGIGAGYGIIEMTQEMKACDSNIFYKAAGVTCAGGIGAGVGFAGGAAAGAVWPVSIPTALFLSLGYLKDSLDEFKKKS